MEALENLSAGIDSLTITDAQGCVLDTTFQVGEPDLLEITNIDITNATCDGESDGHVCRYYVKWWNSTL